MSEGAIKVVCGPGALADGSVLEAAFYSGMLPLLIGFFAPVGLVVVAFLGRGRLGISVDGLEWATAAVLAVMVGLVLGLGCGAAVSEWADAATYGCR